MRRQEFGLRAASHPARGDLALRAVPGATTVICDGRVAAGDVLTTHDVAAEGRGSATLDRAHHLELAEAHMAAVGVTPSGAWSRKYPRPPELDDPWRAGVAGGPSFGSVSRSSGLITVRSTLMATWV